MNIKLITQCASRKTISNVPKTEMVNFNHILDINDRIVLWLESLNSQPITINSWDLYTGHYYQILNQTLNKIKNVEKSIISTGYGILYEEDIVTDYMVTYASHVDKPTKINQLKGVDYKKWHKLLCQKRNKPQLNEWVDKDDLVIVILGNDYLKIVEEDLNMVYNKLSHKDNFIVISTTNKSFIPNTLPIDGSWRKWLGGPQNVMGPNTFKKIIDDNLPLNYTYLNNHFLNVYKPQAEKSNIKYPDSFFLEIISNHPHLSQGKLIKQLRNQGISISTGRMGRLYNKK